MVVGSNPNARYQIDIFHFIIVKIVMFVGERPKKRKRGREWPIFNI